MNRLPARTKGPIQAEAGNGRPSDWSSSPSPSESIGRSLKLLRFPDVRDRTGLSRSTIWRLERRGVFPKHRRILSNAVAWVEEEVMAWIRSKIEDVAV
jgi:prophage regulatory protein